MSKKPKEMAFNKSKFLGRYNALENSNFVIASTFISFITNLELGLLQSGGKRHMQQWNPGVDREETIASTKEKGGNHSSNAVTAAGPIYFIWETKEGITSEEFQEFVDGPTGLGFGLNALMNICKPIYASLINGQKPYQKSFS